jgi:hypothetical protein
MLAQIRNSRFFRVTNVVLLVGAALALSSCATKQPPQIVSDGAGPGRESTLPWNEQEKWESQGQFGPMAERMNSGH